MVTEVVEDNGSPSGPVNDSSAPPSSTGRVHDLTNDHTTSDSPEIVAIIEPPNNNRTGRSKRNQERPRTPPEKTVTEEYPEWAPGMDFTRAHYEAAYSVDEECVKDYRKHGKPCTSNPNCFVKLGPEGHRGFWAAKPDFSSVLGPDVTKSLRAPLPEAATRGLNTAESPLLPVGLKNLGATCYMNILVQALFANTTFRSGVYAFEKADLPPVNLGPPLFNPPAQKEITTPANPSTTGTSTSTSAAPIIIPDATTSTKTGDDGPSDHAAAADTTSASTSTTTTASTTNNQDAAPPVNDPEPIPPERFLGELQMLFAHLQGGKERAYNPVGFTNALQLPVCEQQDVGEFNTLLMDYITKTLESSSDEKVASLVDDLYQGTQSYVRRCLTCGSESDRSKEREPYYDIKLSIKGKGTLEKALDSHLQVEKLTGDNQFACDTCASKQDGESAVVLRSLPPVLNVNLIRYEIDPRTWNKRKVKDSISFPHTLDMSEHVPPPEDDPDGSKYELAGVLIHLGSSAGGHYLAQLRDLSGQAGGGWFYYDDDHVRPIPTSRIGRPYPLGSRMAMPDKKPGSSKKDFSVDPEVIDDSSEETPSSTLKSPTKKNSKNGRGGSKGKRKAVVVDDNNSDNDRDNDDDDDDEDIDDDGDGDEGHTRSVGDKGAKAKAVDDSDDGKDNEEEDDDDDVKLVVKGPSPMAIVDDDVDGDDEDGAEGGGKGKDDGPPRPGRQARFSSSAAYMLIYVRKGAELVGNPDLPPPIAAALEAHNRHIEEGVASYNSAKEACLSEIQLRKVLWADVNNDVVDPGYPDLGAPTGDDDDSAWLSWHWLQRWAESVKPPGPLSNAGLLCPHGKLKPEQPELLRRVSWSRITSMLHRLYGGDEPLHGPDALCPDCLKTLYMESYEDDLRRAQQNEFREAARRKIEPPTPLPALHDVRTDPLPEGHPLLAEIEEEHGPAKEDLPPPPTIGYWLSRDFVRRFLKKIPTSEQGAPPPMLAPGESLNADIACPHGNLTPELGDRRLVSEKTWILAQAAASVGATDPGEPVAFPAVTWWRGCRICRHEEEQTRLAVRAAKRSKAAERRTLSRLFSGAANNVHGGVLSTPGQYHIIPESWVSTWRAHVRDPSNPAPGTINVSSLLCEHGQCLFPVQSASESDLERALASYAVITHDEWVAVCETYDRSENTPEDGITFSVLPPEGGRDRTNIPHADIAARTPSIPELCPVCPGKVWSSWAEGTGHLVVVRKGRKRSGSSSRGHSRGNIRDIVSVSSSDTMTAFKLRLYQLTNIMPLQMKLVNSDTGEEIPHPDAGVDEDEATLEALGIRKYDVLRLILLEEDDEALMERLSRTGKRQVERGFAGSALSSAPVPSPAKRARTDDPTPETAPVLASGNGSVPNGTTDGGVSVIDGDDVGDVAPMDIDPTVDTGELSPTSRWDCHACTSHNPLGLNVCSVCETPRLLPVNTSGGQSVPEKEKVKETDVPAPEPKGVPVASNKAAAAAPKGPAAAPNKAVPKTTKATPAHNNSAPAPKAAPKTTNTANPAPKAGQSQGELDVQIVAHSVPAKGKNKPTDKAVPESHPKNGKGAPAAKGAKVGKKKSDVALPVPPNAPKQTAKQTVTTAAGANKPGKRGNKANGNQQQHGGSPFLLTKKMKKKLTARVMAEVQQELSKKVEARMAEEIEKLAASQSPGGKKRKREPVQVKKGGGKKGGGKKKVVTVSDGSDDGSDDDGDDDLSSEDEQLAQAIALSKRSYSQETHGRRRKSQRTSDPPVPAKAAVYETEDKAGDEEDDEDDTDNDKPVGWDCSACSFSNLGWNASCETCGKGRYAKEREPSPEF